MSNIPVRNWWHMLLYAWDLVEFQDQFDAQTEDAPDLRALLTRILADLTDRQIRRGLRGDYVDRSEPLKTVRGRIDFNRTLSDMLLYKGELHCEYQEYSVNVPRNQIIASTLNHQLRSGFTRIEKDNQDRIRELVSDLERLVRMMVEVERVRLRRSFIATEMRRLGANEREYKLMLLICEMLHDLRMPLEDSTGSSLWHWDKLQEWKVFEKFVANFYRMWLPREEWTVDAQQKLDWNSPHANEAGDSVGVPAMHPDIMLTYKGDREQVVIIDTKWYRSAVSEYYGSLTVHSANLYQMYAYLASQDHRGYSLRTATGILLYAQTSAGEQTLRTRIDEHPFWVHTLDLSQEWQSVEYSLLDLAESAVQKPISEGAS